MSYIVQRQDRFYVVAYDGLDPLTGRERRRWHPVGHDREEAEHLAARLDRERDATFAAPTGPVTFGEYLTNTWIPHKRRQVRATTGYRYAWFVDRYVQPAIGDIPLRRLRADHLDTLYDTLANSGGRDGNGLAPKTILEVHWAAPEGTRKSPGTIDSPQSGQYGRRHFAVARYWFLGG